MSSRDCGIRVRRATSIDGKLLRQFLQKEGVKVFVGSKREAAKAGLGE